MRRGRGWVSFDCGHLYDIGGGGNVRDFLANNNIDCVKLTFVGI